MVLEDLEDLEDQVVLVVKFHLGGLENPVVQMGQEDQVALVDQMDQVVLVDLKDHYLQVDLVDLGDLGDQMVLEDPMDQPRQVAQRSLEVL